MTADKSGPGIKDRATALVALKELQLDLVVIYRGHVITRSPRGYALRGLPGHVFKSPLTVLAVADGARLANAVYMVRCVTCYRDFEAKSPDAVYCSSRCRQKAYRTRKPWIEP